LIEPEMMSGGHMGKNSFQSRASTSSSMFNGDARMLEYWYPRICVVRKVNTIKTHRKVFICLPFVKGLFNNGYVMSEWFV